MTVEIKFDLFRFENPVTVEVSCVVEIYPTEPRPETVDAITVGPNPTRLVVVDVSCDREIYPNVPRPATVDWRLSEEI